MLLVVAKSSGSSPGRAGYKMAVAADGELCGSIGGGVMEVRLVERAKSQIRNLKSENRSELVEQIHRKDTLHPSGMICSGKQTVIMRLLASADKSAIDAAIDAVENRKIAFLTITSGTFNVESPKSKTQSSLMQFEQRGESEFLYSEKLSSTNNLYIIGGGHCALALSELMSRLGFYISIFDDRPDLNTIEKNEFAEEVTVIDGYENIGEMVVSDDNAYVVVMTIGYKSDAVVMRKFIDHEFKYFGVLGSEAKMATLLRELKNEGVDADKLARIRTPIGVPINSRTPEEIAVSIAAEIIAVKNA